MASPAEGSPPGIGRSAVSICVTKSLFILEKFPSRITISSNKAPPPPLLPISSPPSQQQQQQQQPDMNDLHPIIQMMREQEVGRAMITLAVPAATAVLISDSGKFHLLVAHILVVGLMMGCMAIWNGILIRTNFPRLANVFEQVGISIVLVSLYGLVASLLPKGVSWILWLSGGLCLVPFILARFYST